jgi:hypothetical protein
MMEKDRSGDRLVKTSAVQKLLGGCSHMTVRRLVADPESGFPAPIYLGRYPHFWFNDVVRWIDRQAERPRKRPPQSYNFERGRKAKAKARRAGAGAPHG